MMNQRDNGYEGRIKLEKLPNTRDLGGIKTIDGKKILPRRLIRSGTLYEATGEDIRILSHQCRLGTVIDFRTETEQRQKPDPKMPGIYNISNPILDEKTVGITFEEEEAEAEEGERDAIKSILLHASSLGGKPETYVDRLYEDLVLNHHASDSYSRFFYWKLITELCCGTVRQVRTGWEWERLCCFLLLVLRRKPLYVIL